MKLQNILLVLLLALPAYALVVENTGKTASDISVYGEFIAYESNNEIHVYDILRKEDYSFGPGNHPSIFGYTLVFATKETNIDLNEDGDTSDSIIQYANVRDKSLTNTKLVGRNPNVFSNTIVFSTKESELEVDYTNDGDQDDDIIRIYSISSGVLVNTRAVGDFPVTDQDHVVFHTDEFQVGYDLNGDDDSSDRIIRIFDRELHSVEDIPYNGEYPVLSKGGYGIFISNNQLMLLNVSPGQAIDVNISGSSASIYDSTVMFVKDSKIHVLNLDTMTVVKLEVSAEKVSLFEETAAILSSESIVGDLNDDGDQDDLVIRFIRAEDIDDDELSDFFDNCPAISNLNQTDSDNDGTGDVCEIPDKPDKIKDKEVEEKSEGKQVEKPATNQSVSEPAPSRLGRYWYLLLVLLLPFIIYYGHKYYKKRQKSFGF